MGSEPVGFTSQNTEQTERLGQHLGALLLAGDIICLAGSLGAGKTALTRGIGMGWGAQDPVTSPTFTLIHEHRRAQDAQVLYHVDCYRLSGMDDAWGVGLEDLLTGEGGPVVIEWPENVQDVLPLNRLWITLTILDETRRHMQFEAAGERYRTLLRALQQNMVGES